MLGFCLVDFCISSFVLYNAYYIPVRVLLQNLLWSYDKVGINRVYIASQQSQSVKSTFSRVPLRTAVIYITAGTYYL